MKIAFISALYSGWGGSEELWVCLAGHSLEHGNECIISIHDHGSVNHKISTLNKSGAKLSKRPNEMHLAQSYSGKLLAKFYRFFSKDFFKPVKEFNPAILVISQGGTYDFLWQKDLYQFLLNWEKCPVFLINQFNEENINLSTEEAVEAREIFSKARKVFFVSERNRMKCEEQIQSVLPNADVIKNPILTEIKALEYPVENRLRMAMVGRLDIAVKGHDILLAVLSQEKWKKRDWKLTIYGSGKDILVLENLVREKGLTDKVYFGGYVRDITSVWKDNQLLLMPSRAEGTPLSLLEAMACARSAVVTNVGGNAEVVEDGVTGFVADEASDHSFDKALERCWERKDQLKEFGLKAFQELEKDYKDDPVKKLYNMIINS